VQLAIYTLGVEAVARDMLRFSGRARDLSPAMGEVLDLIRDSERRQFDSQGSYGSGGWQPLAASTRKQKARLNLDSRILRATGEMFDDLTGDGAGQIAVARHDGLDFGTTLPHAKFHQQGRGVPKRPVVQLPERDRRSAVKIVQRYLIEDR
jgi:phage gpG-like protein